MLTELKCLLNLFHLANKVINYCRCFQYESPKVIRLLENASVGQNVSYVRACNPDTESTIYYYLIGLMRLHIFMTLSVSGRLHVVWPMKYMYYFCNEK